jgi:3',5'-cyclic AMP phosphodiesterase CpdA
MLRLAHLTDLHTASLAGVPPLSLIGKRALGYLSWRRKRRYRHLGSTLEKTVDAMLAERPDAVVITGDLIHIGLRSEMDQLRDFLKALSSQLPLLLVPGNHDLYHQDSLANLHQAWGDLPLFGTHRTNAAAPQWPTVLDIANVRIIGLCSAYPAPLLRADGRLGETQLTALETLLASNPQRHCVIALHHPVGRGLTSRRKALRDAERLQQLLISYKVGVVLHGHLHHNLEYYIGGRDGTRCYCTAPASSCHDPVPASFRTLDYDSAEHPSMRLLQANGGGYQLLQPPQPIADDQ